MVIYHFLSAFWLTVFKPHLFLRIRMILPTRIREGRGGKQKTARLRFIEEEKKKN